MAELIWCDPLSVPLLQWLARGSLKQNLVQAIRLWVWLHLLYGKQANCLLLPEPFGYADWRDAFFTATHPKQDEKPTLHDRQCLCAKVTAAWLFGDRLSLSQPEWAKALQQPDDHQQIQERSQQFQQSLQQYDAVPDDLHMLLWQTRLFGVTRRTLASDLQRLANIGWLRRNGNRYERVHQFPTRPLAVMKGETEIRLAASDLAFLTQPDLAAIANNLAQDINGQQRFFVHLDYVVPQQQLDQVDEWQSVLRELWQRQAVPPILLDYRGAGSREAIAVVVYPVCIYHYQRGPYLCAFRQVPLAESLGLDWRNYRLDRIEAITPLSWNDRQVPAALRQRYRTHTLPTPEEIQLRMDEAWGFDYYQPSELLVLRFDREWDDRYIQNSVRHSTFESVSYEQVGQLLQTHLRGQSRQKMLQRWRSCSSDDAYYQAQYRQDDPNVRQRLRAWRPHVEVLLPWELRQRMAREVQQEWNVYYGAIGEFDGSV